MTRAHFRARPTPERASRLRAEKDFLVRELAAATGLGGRPSGPEPGRS